MELARDAFVAAISDIETVDDDNDTIPIMQLLRDNLTDWTFKKEEEDYREP